MTPGPETAVSRMSLAAALSSPAIVRRFTGAATMEKAPAPTKRHKSRQHPGLELLGSATGPILAGPGKGGAVPVTEGVADFLHVEAIGPEQFDQELAPPDLELLLHGAAIEPAKSPLHRPRRLARLLGHWLQAEPMPQRERPPIQTIQVHRYNTEGEDRFFQTKWNLFSPHGIGHDQVRRVWRRGVCVCRIHDPMVCWSL